MGYFKSIFVEVFSFWAHSNMDTQNKVSQENQQHILQMASYLFSKCKISKMSLKYKKMSTSVKLMIAVFRSICLPHIKYIQKHLY